MKLLIFLSILETKHLCKNLSNKKIHGFFLNACKFENEGEQSCINLVFSLKESPIIKPDSKVLETNKQKFEQVL